MELCLYGGVCSTQGHGFCGRVNKTADTCYSFWVGAALHMLGAGDFMGGAIDTSMLPSSVTPDDEFESVTGVSSIYANASGVPDDSMGLSMVAAGTVDPVRHWHLQCEYGRGGFGKTSDALPDILHSFYSLSALSLLREEGLQELDPVLGISRRCSRQYGWEVKTPTLPGKQSADDIVEP